jgi:prephenate dehydratase
MHTGSHQSTKLIVAFQGERGAYSEEAALSYFRSKIEFLPCKTLRAVFQAVESDKATVGMVPVENSLEGGVSETYDLLLSSSLVVSGEYSLRVKHCLISNPGVRIEDVKRIYSHPQALAQCRRFLDSLGAEVIPYYDTAGSAYMIKREGLRDAAAIASKRAAEIYSLQILAESIEDSPNNYTRFFVIGKFEREPTGRDKTSVVFTTRHVPGALYAALGVFAKRSINLTKIESRPTKQTPWEYNFYVDFEGHKMDVNVQAALEELRAHTLYLKILGSYPKAEQQT